MDRMQLIAFTRDQVAELAGLSARQVDYWRKTDLVAPEADARLGGAAVRLYGYQATMALLIVAELRHRSISLQHVRKIVAYVASLGYERPLLEVHYAVAGGEVFIQHPDGGWEGDRRPHQGVFHHVLELEPLRARIRRATVRPAEAHGATERRRGTLGHKEVFAGTRVPVDAVVRYLRHGASVRDVLEAYPALDRRDVEGVARTAV